MSVPVCYYQIQVLSVKRNPGTFEESQIKPSSNRNELLLQLIFGVNSLRGTCMTVRLFPC